MNYSAEQINMAFSNLSETSSRAISQLNIKEKELEIITKYNIQPEIAIVLSNYIIFILIGLIEKKDFELKIKEDFNLSKEDSINIIKDINTMIFEEVKEKEKEINIKEELKQITFDPQFNSLPESVQRAISDSNWKEKLYNIAPKYNLNVEQMGILENTTIRFIKNEINQNQYENSLTSDLKIEKEKLTNLINDINDNILKTIRQKMMEQGRQEAPTSQEKPVTKEKDEDEIPLPPYGISSKKQVESSKEKQDQNKPTNIFEEKLYAPISSNQTNGTYHKDSPDPYREPV